jgi:hypothetical protein
MRRLRIPLACLAVLAVLYDVQEYFTIRTHGFPPKDLLAFDQGWVLDATTRETLEYGLFLLGVGLLQAFVFRQTWNAWRHPKS